MYQNLWFAFNISDQYMPETDGHVMQFIESEKTCDALRTQTLSIQSETIGHLSHL